MAIDFNEIGKRLKAYRLGRGLTTDEIAERLGISRAAVYRIEGGEVVKTETLERLAAVLETSVASLLGTGVEYYSSSISTDAAALGFHVAISIASRLYPGQVTQPRTMFTELPFAVAVTKGRGAPFLTRLNAGIAAIRADGRWQKINDRWTAK